MKIFGFYLVYALLWIVALLPFPLLYLLSDIYYILIFQLLRYRRRVVFQNLRLAFPEKNNDEIRLIAKKFYRHFCDYLVESVKILHLNKVSLSKRFVYKNPEILNRLFEEGKSAVLVSAHYGNWEWMIDIESEIRHKFLAIYKPLADPNFDRMLKSLRQKYARGSEMVSMNNVYKVLISSLKSGHKTLVWFLVDQTPPANYPFWIKFLNRETPFYSGPAKIARKFDQPIVFMQINKRSRGYYDAEFSILVKDPQKFTEEEMISKYVKKIESGIRHQPEYWLWTHRRWKHKKENVVENQQ